MLKTQSSVFADQLPSPIEVWLSQPNLDVTCRIVHEDESTEDVDVDSLSMRGAQREITGWLMSLGYAPVGRWSVHLGREAGDDIIPAETSRRFRAV